MGVETRILNQAVKRNFERFPDQFMFQLTELEFSNWKSQFVISNSDKMGLRNHLLYSQNKESLCCLQFLKVKLQLLLALK